MPEKELQSDLALMNEFSPEEAPSEEETKTEEEGLNYYYNMMLPDLQAATIEEKMDFVKKVLNS